MLPTIQLNDIVLIYKDYNIKRGDIVLFRPPESQHINDQEWIKRVVGLPGEVISIYNGNVYINGKLLSEDYRNIRPAYDFEPYSIPSDSYFLLGDNRNNSIDSHIWGSLPKKNIIGTIILKVWPQIKTP